MSERKVYDCDQCGLKNLLQVGRIILVIDRSTDAAGSRDNDIVYADLCVECLSRSFESAMKKLGYEESRKWHSRLKFVGR